MNPNVRNFALWVIIFLLVLALVTLFQNPGQRSASYEMNYSQFLNEVDVGPRVERRHPGTGDPRHAVRRPPVPDLFAERPEPRAEARRRRA